MRDVDQPGLRAAPLISVRWAACLAAAMALPLLFVSVPPLVDLPGHLGRFAIQSAAPGSALARYYDFTWGLTLNLGTDLLVEGLRHFVGIIAATWLVTVAIVMLSVAGILAVAWQCNPRGCWSLPWALPFVHGFAFRYGFLNFALGSALALLGFALWQALAGRRGWRAALFVPLSALILVAHAIGGGLMLAMILGDAAWRIIRGPRAHAAREIGALWPLIGGFAAIALWLASGASPAGKTVWRLDAKWNALLMAVRDQSPVLDIGTVALGLAVLAWGLWQGARIRAPGAVLGLALVFLALPTNLSGVAHVDQRVLPVVFMLAFALFDWGAVAARTRRAVLVAGFVLLLARLAVTTVAFAGYGASYARELGALDHVARGSRVMALVEVACGMAEWRGERLDHLPNLASVRRDAWVNTHWAMAGVQQVQVRYRPSPDYFSDPSGFVWPVQCFDPKRPFAARYHHSVEEVLPRLPLAGVDYLWLVRADRPQFEGPGLRRIWSSGSSALYAVRPVPKPDATP